MNALVVSAITTASAVLAADEKAPKDDDVVAGWTGFAIFAFLLVAVVLIGWALTRSLRTAARAKDAGVYGDERDAADAADADRSQGDGDTR